MADKKDAFDIAEEELAVKQDRFDDAEKELNSERVNNALDAVSDIKKIFETYVSMQKSLAVGLLGTGQDNKQLVSIIASSMNDVADKMCKMGEGMKMEKCPTKWQFEIVRGSDDLIKTVNVTVIR